MVSLLGWVDVQSHSQLSVAFKPCAFFIAFELLLVIAFCVLRSTAFGFLLDALTFACDEDFVLTWLLLLAWAWRVARGHTRMSTCTQLFAAWLFAGFFALSRSMALLLASMSTAFELCIANITALHLCQETRLVFLRVLPTETRLSG